MKEPQKKSGQAGFVQEVSNTILDKFSYPVLESNYAWLFS